MVLPIHLDPHMLASLPGCTADMVAPKVGDLVTFTCTWGAGFTEHGRVERCTTRGWLYVEVAGGAVYRLPAKGYVRVTGHSPVTLGAAASGLLQDYAAREGGANV